ncbi:WD REPEAT PROTEIN 8-RELATED [Salix purpurea]|uniref:WD REPEAT PROTEIN 8-RELATED n=1 Tax=Salix purpurea TaxID=77065 RepID=A0A9Q0T9C7_SALPP|nr:WD REPEAT PROTEIN 8-RELATED [Salix purpurea]
MILEPPKKCPFPIANHMPRMIPNNRPGFQNSSPTPKAVSRNTSAPTVVQLFSCLDKISHIEWANDSEYILCGLYKRPMIQAWSLTQPEWTCKIDEGPAGIAYARWSPDSRHILTTSDFQLRLTVWSLLNTACVHVQGPKHGSKGVSFTKDGKFAAICTRRDCKDYVNLLSCHAWEIMGAFSVDTLDLADIEWSPDDSAIVIWDSPLEYKVLIYSPDGRCLSKYQAYESGLGVKKCFMVSLVANI